MSFRLRTALWILVVAGWGVLFSHAAALPAIDKAQWIWGNLSNATCELRRAFTLDAVPASGTVLITADNGYELFVNGSLVGSDIGAESDVWQTVERYDITPLLARGRNVIGIRGTDLGGVRGVLAAVRVEAKGSAGTVAFETDASWRTGGDSEPNDYSHPEFVESADWSQAIVVGANGMAPWGKLAWAARNANRKTRSPIKVDLAKPGPEFAWPGHIAFLSDDCSVYVPLRGDAWGVAFRVRDWSRAYTEFDLPCPSKIGRKLFTLQPGPGAKPRLLYDAGSGVMGSPSATFDGKSLLVAMASKGDKFFHIYRIAADTGKAVRLTDGTFHDIDPAELPDGRIVFTSTRIGTFEEYHSPPSRALFVMNADGSDIRPLTHTLIFDNEPKVMADGRVVFIRTDNFFDRGKVETHLHVIRPDGTDGLTEAGADVGADYGVRLRILGYGSPAPLPDGRLAFISNHGNFIASVGSTERNFHRLPDPIADLSALPDGRLLATVLRGMGRQTVSDVIAVIDPRDNKLVSIYESRGAAMHSPVYLGACSKPAVIPDYTASAAELVSSGTTKQATGFLFCQDARFTKKAKADWGQIKAVRLLGAIPLTVRSSHSHIVHVGHQTVELGTVPLAPDGSFFAEVPADMPLALQAVDAEGRSELNEMSWIYVKPGERRSCIGCHQPRETAPPLNGRTSLALGAGPVKALGQGDPHKFRGNNPGVTGMMDLQFERFRECASINLHNGRSSREEVAALVRTLRGSDASLRISAAQRLGLWREHTAAPALTQRLTDPVREVRIASALALASCGTADSIPGLINALGDADPIVAQAALVALNDLTGGAVTNFNSFDPPTRRRAVAEQLRLVGAQGNVAGIRAALATRIEARAEPLRSAIVALGHIGDSNSAAVLRRYVANAASQNPYPAFERDNRTDRFTYSFDSPWNPRTLQEAVRALGQIKDSSSVALLGGILSSNIEPRTANLYLAEAVVEALGRIGTPECADVLLSTLLRLKDYWDYVGWYSDHPALYACHSSPVHARLIEALDRLDLVLPAQVVPALVRSVPTDPDRALFPFNDDYEVLVGRLLRRSPLGSDIVETCLSILGEPSARSNNVIAKAIGTTHAAWGGKPGPQNRAAQILSLACNDAGLEPRIRRAFDHFVAMPEEPIKRELGNPTWTPVRHWTLFYLARALGNVRDPRSTDSLLTVLGDQLAEARHGRPDPATPEIHFLHNDYTPCWRAAAAWALGQIGDTRAAERLIHVVSNFDNAPDVRHTAAQALAAIRDPKTLPALAKLAATYPEVSTRRVLLHACDATAEPTPVSNVLSSR